MKKTGIFLLAAMLPMSVMAADDAPRGATLDLVLRRMGLELSKTTVRHAEQYADSPVSALSASNQDFIKGVFDSALEYRKNKLNWDTSLFMEYGRTKLKPYDGPETIDDNADDIVLSTDLSYACWQWGDFKFGPMVRGAYDTEFHASGDAPRQQILRASGGMSLFDHPIIKSLYLAGLYEYDFTYSDNSVSKTGAEIGWRLEYPVREGVKFSSNGYYREYFSYSAYEATDFKRDLSAVVRLDTNLWGKFTMGPYAQYRRALARGAENYGSNFIIGISFNYITRFGLLRAEETN